MIGDTERWRRIMDGSAVMYSYPSLFDNRIAHSLWRLLFCPRGWHLWDEVLSGLNEAHYLTCDACPKRFVGHGWQEPS